MKKKNVIIIGVVALILVLAVGYALFSDTLTINGTASAKGDFSLSYTCDIDDSSTNKESAKCTVEGSDITMESTLSKPTDSTVYNVTVTNNGSIPAVLKTVDSSNNFAVDMTAEGDVLYIDKTNSLFANYEVYKNGEDIGAYGDSAVEQASITLQPEESIVIKVYHLWANSEDLGLESQPELSGGQATLNYNMTLGFQQAS